MGLPGVSALKSPPAMQEIWVRSLGQEDPLEEGMATAPLFFAGESHGERSLAGYRVAKGQTRLKRLSTAEHTTHHKTCVLSSFP